MSIVTSPCHLICLDNYSVEEARAATMLATGPFQQRRGMKGQYVYWITMPYPKAETIIEHGVKTPEDYDCGGFIQLGLAVHNSCGIGLEEALCFRKPHADGKPHLNLLVRAHAGASSGKPCLVNRSAPTLR